MYISALTGCLVSFSGYLYYIWVFGAGLYLVWELRKGIREEAD